MYITDCRSAGLEALEEPHRVRQGRARAADALCGKSGVNAGEADDEVASSADRREIGGWIFEAATLRKEKGGGRSDLRGRAQRDSHLDRNHGGFEMRVLVSPGRYNKNPARTWNGLAAHYRSARSGIASSPIVPRPSQRRVRSPAVFRGEERFRAEGSRELADLRAPE
ncbi:hypothetical protein DFH09DRAFT_1083964 [Mycena vulgaris]|nr:hypothetical protein DFH09DRAFT_1083964 [Mycena vulgaris]